MGSTFAGWYGGCTGTSPTCQVTMNSNVSVTATFNLKATTYIITAATGANGFISPQGAVTVNSGANQAFSIPANSGYRVADVKVDGGSQGAISSYTFSNVTASHSITATFAQAGSGPNAKVNAILVTSDQ
ncbi:MAG: hypothetical protein NTY64_21395 [Deltaproteobacteria bacterium]|nr:hypothetical protein [Deltaproteobacteria bacterium]